MSKFAYFGKKILSHDFHVTVMKFLRSGMFNPNESLTKGIVILFHCSFFYANIFMRRSIPSCGLPQSIFILEGNIEMNLEETDYEDGHLILMMKLRFSYPGASYFVWSNA